MEVDMMEKKMITPRISMATRDQLRQVFGAAYPGAEYVLNSWPALYKRTIHGLKGKFDRDELMLMVDAMNGTMLTPGITGQHIGAKVADGIDLDGLDIKRDVGGITLKAKIEQLSAFERACLEWWIQTFWIQEDHGDIEEYVATLI
jgi:hypothetical protein